MILKLLTEHHLEFLSLKGGCRGSSESTHVKMLIVGITCTGSVLTCAPLTCTMNHPRLIVSNLQMKSSFENQ